MSVRTFQRRCRASDITINAELGGSIRSLAELFRPTSQHDPFLKDFTRVILQNLGLVQDIHA